MRRRSRILLAVIIVIVVMVLLTPSIDVAVDWFQKVFAQSDQGNLTVEITGRTELLGKDDKVIQVMMIQKIPRLGVFTTPEGEYVKAMRITVQYKCEGEGVDWDTLEVKFYASGTGDFSKRLVSNEKEGTFKVRLDINTATLGKTVNPGDRVDWFVTTYLIATVEDIAGNTLTATSEEVRHVVRTVYVEPTFNVQTSSAGEVETETGTMETEVQELGGGCGREGEHLVWVFVPE